MKINGAQVVLIIYFCWSYNSCMPHNVCRKQLRFTAEKSEIRMHGRRQIELNFKMSTRGIRLERLKKFRLFLNEIL